MLTSYAILLLFDRSVPQEAPREVFAQLLPRGKTRGTGNGLVTSVLAPIAGLQGGNGAKQIDVIARFAIWNLIH